MTDAIAWALVHFLWQGAALALIAALLMRLASAAPVRYMIGVATLAAMVITVGMTAALDTAAATGSQIVQGPTGSTVQGSVADANLGPEPLDPWTPGPIPRQYGLPTVWILTLWIIGVVVLSVRALGGWWVARRVAREAITPLSDELQAVAHGLAQRLGIRRVVGVYESSRVSVPVMIGWLRPVVLMPPAALAGLSLAQVEAIIAHEFAHIRRHDYLVNLLQTAVETALFFHPAVWWISREIRRERELCCDELAVSVSDRLTYATALSTLAHLHPPSLALAATDGSLRDRVRRIITNSPSSESAKGGWMAIVPLLLVVYLAAPSAVTQSAAVPANVGQEPAPVVITADKGVVTLKTSSMELKAERIEITTEPRENAEAPMPEIPPALPLVMKFFDVSGQSIALQAPPPLPQAPAAPRLSTVIVQGQVLRPGRASLSPDQMTVMKAIAVAGGFSAQAGDIEIRRPGVEQAINITRRQAQEGADLNLIDGDTVVVRQGFVFFVNGEVTTPGQKVWVPGMSVLKAVGLAGGTTSRGKLGHILRPVKDATGKILKYQKITNLKPETEILPDDQLVIARKWFGE